MSRSTRIWTVLVAIYLGFFFWYTSLRGPLSHEEIAGYLSELEGQGADPERLKLWRQFMESDTGDDFAMINVIQMRETPEQVEGVLPGESSAEVMNRYIRPFFARALLTAAHPILLGSAAAPALDTWGIEGAEDWTTGGLVRYRSRRDLMKQAIAMGAIGVHDFKTAAIAKTVAYPLDPWFQLGDPRLLLALLLTIVGLAVQQLGSRRRSALR